MDSSNSNGVGEVANSPNGTVFINYRRKPDGGWANSIVSTLRTALPGVDFFIDINGNIPPGADFIDFLEEKVIECDVLIAIIGPFWLDARHPDTGERLIDRDDDYVRHEISLALAHGKRIVPLTVGGADIPARDALPEPLKPLVRKHRVQISQEHYERDMEMFTSSMSLLLSDENEPSLGAGDQAQEPPANPNPRRSNTLFVTRRDAVVSATTIGIMVIISMGPPERVYGYLGLGPIIITQPTATIDLGSDDWDLFGPKILSVSLSPDGDQVAFSLDDMADNSIRIWDISDDSEILRINEPVGLVYSIDFSDDAQQIAVGSGDGAAYVWDRSAKSTTARLDHPASVRRVRFLNNNELGTLAEDGQWRKWGIEEQRIVSANESHASRVFENSRSNSTIDLHASGKLNGDVYISRGLDRGEAERLAVLRASNYSVNTVSFSFSGRWLATGSSDGKVKIWDLERFR